LSLTEMSAGAIGAPDRPVWSTVRTLLLWPGSRGVYGAPPRASALGGKCSGEGPNSDDDPTLVIQDMDLLSPLSLKLSHPENPSPDGFQVGGQMSLSRQRKAVPANQTEFVVRHSVSSLDHPHYAERRTRTEVPNARLFKLRFSLNQLAVAFAGLFWDFRSKNKA
jgi:hypothetical protein